MPGILDGILGGGGAPKSTEVPLDPVTNEMINDNTERSRTSANDIASNRMQGASDAAYGSLASPEAFAHQQTALGMDGTGQALQNRYQKQLGDDLSGLSTMTAYESQLERAQKLAKAQNYLKARQNIQTQAYHRQMMAYQAQESARSSVLSSILGIAGTAAGAALGGPAGAMAGSQLAKVAAPQPAPMPSQGMLGVNSQLPSY